MFDKTKHSYESCGFYERGLETSNKVSKSEMKSLTTFQAEHALATDETPVGCVFVHEGRIIGKGINDTNKSMNVRKVAQRLS